MLCCLTSVFNIPFLRDLDGRTDERTDERTDQRTNSPYYRDACTHLKIREENEEKENEKGQQKRKKN